MPRAVPLRRLPGPADLEVTGLLHDAWGEWTLYSELCFLDGNFDEWLRWCWDPLLPTTDEQTPWLRASGVVRYDAVISVYEKGMHWEEPPLHVVADRTRGLLH